MSQPGDFVVFGPDANCTLTLCDIKMSVYQYRPSLAANSIFLALFALTGLIHTYLGFRWKSWWFAICMLVGCVVEVIGYAGRIQLYDNPWSFGGFLMQICLITFGPVFYTASIYVTLSQTIKYLDISASRINPALFYWIFIPIDIICLILQAAGGALSTTSSGSSSSGVDVAIAGLSLQVASLFVFGVLFADYVFAFIRKHGAGSLDSRTKIFFSFLGVAWALIEARCFYRAYELSKGYQNSDLITDEGLFIGLEGVMVFLAVVALMVGHPGFLFSKKIAARPGMPEKNPSSSSAQEAV